MSSTMHQAGYQILIIDDDPSISTVVRGVLDGNAMQLSSATTAATGRRLLADNVYDVVILDSTLPDAPGLEFLREIRSHDVDLPVLVLISGNMSDTAIEAIKYGAYDTLRRPLDYGVLRQRVEEACRLSKVRAATKEDVTISTSSPSSLLVGECVAMQQVLNAIGRVARYDGPVLILGEVGTGKETVARAIHQNSARAEGPFEIIHCPAYSTERLEDELFVTSDSRPSAMDRCRTGTLVLQEVNELSASLQTRIVEWFRSHTGSWGPQQEIGCRLISCASIDLEQAVRQNRFRADLYYQLAGQVIAVPPVRERRADIPLLVQHMIRVVRDSGQLNPTLSLHVSRAALDRLVEYSWPGNLDELFSVIRRCLIEGDGSIVLGQTLVRATPLHRPNRESTGENVVTDWSELVGTKVSQGSENLYADAVAEMECHLLRIVMAQVQGNQSQAARILGITRASLRKKLRQYTSRT